jgi:archaeosortase C (PEF-CTERM variant)
MTAGSGSLRALVGLVLAGYGLLVLLGVLAHDAPLAGVASLVLGTGLLAWGLPPLPLRRSRLVAAIGAVAVAGVVGYNAALHSTLSPPEWGILCYGLLLLCAAPFLGRPLGRVQVGTLVGWSFPLLLAPLALFSLNAALSSAATGSSATPIVRILVVTPTALALRLLGTPVQVVGNNLILATPRGMLSLGIGLVCAGLYPMVLFGGLVGLHSWQQHVAPRRLGLVVASGLAGLWVLNVLRLVVLARVGVAWGPQALQEAHANLGWILFAAFMALFWAVVLRHAKAEARHLQE